MKQVILIHGLPDDNEFDDPSIPSPSNNQWFPWLQKQIEMKGGISQALEFPFVSKEPVYSGWVSTIENFKISSDTTLVGHSCGGGFLLRYLSENPEIVPGRVILVAPWIDPDNTLTQDFFNFDMDASLAERVRIEIFASLDDMQMILKSVEIIREKIPGTVYHEFADKGHFCTPEFPELLEIL